MIKLFDSIEVRIIKINQIYWILFTDKSSKSLDYLLEANEKGNRITKLYMKYCVAGILFNIVIGSLACILLSLAFEGRIDSKYFIYPGRYLWDNSKSFQFFLNFLNLFFILRVPWDKKTLLGWLAMTICTMVSAGHYYVFSGLLLLFFVGICEHNVAFYKQFNDLIEDLSLKTMRQDLYKYHSLKYSLCKIINSQIDSGV